MPALLMRRDPWWDLDGRGARRRRTGRRIWGAVVVALALVLLGLILARLPAVDAHDLVLGSGRTTVLGALLLDLAASALLMLHGFRRRGE